MSDKTEHSLDLGLFLEEYKKNTGAEKELLLENFRNTLEHSDIDMITGCMVVVTGMRIVSAADREAESKRVMAGGINPLLDDYPALHNREMDRLMVGARKWEQALRKPGGAQPDWAAELKKEFENDSTTEPGGTR